MQRHSTLKTRTPLRARKPWNPTRSPLRAVKRNALKRGGSSMSKSLREDVGRDPEYLSCAFAGLNLALVPCAGRVTREHAMYYKGSKIQEKWAIIPCCAQHHGVDLFQDSAGEAPKILRQWVALNRATNDDLAKYERADFAGDRDRLNALYGVYKPVYKVGTSLGQGVEKNDGIDFIAL